MIRWVLIIWLAAVVLYEMSHLKSAIEGASEAMSMADEASFATRRVRRLHTRAGRLMKVSLVVAVGALLLS